MAYRALGAMMPKFGDVVIGTLVAMVEEAISMSRRNSRQGKTQRRAEREGRRGSMTSGQGPQAVEVEAVRAAEAKAVRTEAKAVRAAEAETAQAAETQTAQAAEVETVRAAEVETAQAVEVEAVRAAEVETVQVAPRPDGSGARNSDEHRSELGSDADDGLSAVEPGEADLDASADPGDFGGLDADDPGLQATLTVLAVLADDISDAADVAEDLAGDLADDLADDLAGDADGLAVPDEPEDLGAPETAQPSAEAAGEDEEILVFSEDDDDLPAARVAIAGATADPVKDYLKQIGKVPLLNAEQEVDLAKRIEAGLFAEEKLAEDQ